MDLGDFYKAEKIINEGIIFNQKKSLYEEYYTFLSKLSSLCVERGEYLKSEKICRDILKLTDNKGIPLLGQYTQDDLNAFLHEATTSVDRTNLPPMLVFKTENQQRYFIYKNKVIPLIIKLCNR